MSTRDIHDQLQELYSIERFAEMVSKITDKILPEAKEWQSRPLNPVCPFVFMDCIHYRVREDGRNAYPERSHPIEKNFYSLGLSQAAQDKNNARGCAA